MARSFHPHQRTATSIIVSTSLVAAGVGLAACSTAPPPPHARGAIAFVIGGRSNMPRPVLVPKARQYLADAILSKDKLFVVGVSGQPELLYTEDMTHNCDSKTACDAVVEDNVVRLQGLLDEVKAESPEADQLGAIAVAAEQLAGVELSGPKRIVFVDNGLQTTGNMPLQAPGALAVDPEEQAKHVTDSELPRLDGVEVLLTGLGAYHDPQPQLPREEVTKLRALWTAVLRTLGAEVDVDSTPLGHGAPKSGLPKVTPVLAEQKPTPGDGGCLKLREDQVGFIPDSADLRDPSRAKEVLTPIAQELRDSGLTASVIGTTALPEPPPYQLSVRRAKRVIDILVALGVPRSSLIPGGVGTNFAGFVPDTDSKGRLIPVLAMQNRLVIVAPVGRSCS